MSSDLRRFPFLSQSADRARMPVALLSGFLGSGKTTLVNALLRDPRLAGTAVAVNEFGPIPIDQDLIDHGSDQTIVLGNGCLCCNLSGDLESAVMRLFARRDDGRIPPFQRLIVEPTGLADPAPIAQAILRNPMMARDMRLAGIVTVVDSLFGLQQLERHKETRKQIALADRIVLTKPDLADTAALFAVLPDINPEAPILTALQGDIDPATLFPPDFFDPAAVTDLPRRSPFIAETIDPSHTERRASASFIEPEPLTWPAFDAWLKSIRIPHAERLLRVKGILNIAGARGPVVVQGVHHVLNNPVVLDAWPTCDHNSRLVLIADPGTIAIARESWMASLPGMRAK